MLNQLRGRNLAHVGCTIGLVLGLLIGMIVGFVITLIVRTAAALDWATFAWIGLTLGLAHWGMSLVIASHDASGDAVPPPIIVEYRRTHWISVTVRSQPAPIISRILYR